MHIVVLFSFFSKKKKKKETNKSIHTFTLVKEEGLVCAMKGTHDLWPCFFLLLLLLLLHLNVPMAHSWMSHGVCEVTTHTWRGKKKDDTTQAAAWEDEKRVGARRRSWKSSKHNLTAHGNNVQTQRRAASSAGDQTFVTSFELLRPAGWGTRLIKQKHGPPHWPRGVRGGA